MHCHGSNKKNFWLPSWACWCIDIAISGLFWWMTTMVGEYIISKPPFDGWWRKRFKPKKDGAGHSRKRRTYSKLEQLTWCHMSNKTNPCDPIPLYRFVGILILDWIGKNPLLNWIGFHGGMNFFFEYVYKESLFLTTNFHRTQTTAEEYLHCIELCNFDNRSAKHEVGVAHPNQAEPQQTSHHLGKWCIHICVSLEISWLLLDLDYSNYSD